MSGASSLIGCSDTLFFVIVKRAPIGDFVRAQHFAHTMCEGVKSFSVGIRAPPACVLSQTNLTYNTAVQPITHAATARSVSGTFRTPIHKE
jgi:hypothetical protein